MYDLDNNSEKYKWADPVNGKGVIYRMIDENNNDCPYDFKNALFYDDRWYYTFSSLQYGNDDAFDNTVGDDKKYCYKNTIGTRHITNLCQSLPFNIFKNYKNGSCHNNYLGYNCFNNTFGYSCYNNTFGNDCSNNSFGNSCSNNTFEDNCCNNILGDNCKQNHIENDSTSNTLGNSCINNLLGRSSYRRNLDGSYNDVSISSLDEYYDNGSGQLVPLKHPDLATQPNILPYKLVGNYVYEQLIAIPEDLKFSTSNGYVKFSIDAPKWEIDKPSILKAVLNSSNIASPNEPQLSMPCIISNLGDTLIVYVSDVLLAEKGNLRDLWLLIEYSSFDSRGGYYDKYSNEVVVRESKYNLYINVEDGYTWEINGKQYNTGLHKLSDEEVTHIMTSNLLVGGIKSTLYDRYYYMKATLEGYTETRNVRVPWSENINTGLWSFGLVYFYETYGGVYSLSYHLPMAAEAIANGEKVILELTNTY